MTTYSVPTYSSAASATTPSGPFYDGFIGILIDATDANPSRNMLLQTLQQQQGTALTQLTDAQLGFYGAAPDMGDQVVQFEVELSGIDPAEFDTSGDEGALARTHDRWNCPTSERACLW